MLAVGSGKVIGDLFIYKRSAGCLDLDRKQIKKKGLTDVIRCIPEMLEKIMTHEHLRYLSVEAGMIDWEAKVFPTFEGLIGTCKKYVSGSRDVNIPRDLKILQG